MRAIGFLMVLTGIGILGRLMITAYKNNKNESIWVKMLLLVSVLVDFALDTTGLILIFIYALILIGVSLIIYF
ncbi:hypothetical protein [Heyndrickxia vini]|uniref:Uncharacterized protein n=1 Tax=Heyndrickxia vini TaxID=1476025 RepID=A0ABX7E402_9BACI|nr:hypothetical protein [Heyndrickxia vini]QQZ10009.1 hypothetical protein I5776_03305 [Heyndrickxia vini]